jgi:hypothetical protein
MGLAQILSHDTLASFQCSDPIIPWGMFVAIPVYRFFSSPAHAGRAAVA